MMGNDRSPPAARATWWTAAAISGLGHAGPGHPQGREMRIDGDVDGLFDLRDLLGRLDGPLFDDGPDERHRGLGRGAVGRDPQPGQQLQLVLGPIRRQEMDLPSGLPDPLQVLFEAGRRHHALHARQGGPVLQRRQRAGPDEILDRRARDRRGSPCPRPGRGSRPGRRCQGRNNKGTSCPGGTGRDYPRSSSGSLRSPGTGPRPGSGAGAARPFGRDRRLDRT